MEEDEVKSYVSSHAYVKWKEGRRIRSVFCKIKACYDGIALLTTDRTRKIRASSIVAINVIEENKVQDELRKLGI